MPAKGHVGASFSVGPNGEIAYTTGSSPSNRLMIRKDKVATELASSGYFEGVSLSRDGSKLVFASGPNHDTRLSLRVMDLKTKKTVIIPEQTDTNQLSPSWSPIKDEIVYRGAKQPELGSSKTGTWKKFEIWVTDVTGNRRQLTNERFQKMSPPRWSADGSKLVFSFLDSQATAKVRVIDSQSGKKIFEALLMDNDNHPFFLNDEVAMVSDRDHPFEYGFITMKPDGIVNKLSLPLGYYMLPVQASDGSIYALEDAEKNFLFRLIAFDPKTGTKNVVMERTEFDEPVKPANR